MPGGAAKQLLPALGLASHLEPYKKLLGVLVRKDCVSVAVSNPYLNLAEPLGAVMLRGGRLPARSFQRLLAGEEQQLAGWLIGYEVQPGGQADTGQVQAQQPGQPSSPLQQREQQQEPLTAQQDIAVQQLRALLSGLVPAAPGGWYGGWSADAAGASCRIPLPQAGLAAAAVAPPAAAAAQQGADGRVNAASTPPPQPPQQQQQQQPVCSLGQQFLQTYLDSLGSLNTFG